MTLNTPLATPLPEDDRRTRRILCGMICEIISANARPAVTNNTNAHILIILIQQPKQTIQFR